MLPCWRDLWAAFWRKTLDYLAHKFLNFLLAREYIRAYINKVSVKKIHIFLPFSCIFQKKAVPLRRISAGKHLYVA